MTISDQRAAELAEALPDGMRCDNARERLLCLVEVLRRLTDQAHPLSNADIRRVLEAKFGPGKAPAENTLNADIRAIRESGCLDLGVHTTPGGTWCEAERLTPQKVRLLLNAVQSSRFLTVAQSNDLQEGLFGLVSHHQEDRLQGEVHVDQRVRKAYQKVFDNCELVLQAIRQRRKLEFDYTYTGFDGKPHVLESASGQVRRVETPIALILSDGNYYLESFSPQPWRFANLLRSRVDRMYDVRISDEPADRGKEVSEARRSVQRRLSESVDMVGAQPRTLFLRVRADHTNVVFDRFGFDLRFSHFDGELGDVATTGITCVTVAESFTFYRWLSSARDGIVMVRPQNEMWVQSGHWKGQVAGKSLQQLQDDHAAMVAGFLRYLDEARAPYLP